MITLSAAPPSASPRDDLFGHASFAESLANSICRCSGNEDLVLALNAPWEAGKLTVLSYVWHFLEHCPETARPVIVNFNSGWFSGQENLARAFLGQLQTMHLQTRLSSAWLERYIDTAACPQRLVDLQQTAVVPDMAREAVISF